MRSAAMRIKLNWAIAESGVRRVLAGVAAMALASCGGGGDGGFLEADNCSPPAQISSTPPTGATAGVEYRYHADATYSCWLIPLILPATCAGLNAIRVPAGASVSGTNVSWTPTASFVNADVPFVVATPADLCGDRAT